MDLLPHFATPWWLFALIVAPGLLLAHVLYGLPGVPGGKQPRHAALALTYAVAWLLLAAWVLSPTWRSRPEIWHPPAVLLLTDESARYAALGARDTARRSQVAARAHYESQGFRVVEAGFGDAASEVAPPHNLQAVLLYSDGRSSAKVLTAFTARVFPVLPELPTREVQGESVFVADEESDERAAGNVVVMWRSLGLRAVNAKATLQFGGRVLWSGVIPHPSDVSSGELVRSVVSVGGVLEARDAAEVPFVLVRPEDIADNAMTANDTVVFDLSASRRVAQTFVRPVSTLSERALMDALREDPGFQVAALPAAEATASQAVVWIRDTKASEVASLSRTAAQQRKAIIVYRLSGADAAAPHVSSPSRLTAFTADARIERAAAAAVFLPAGVVRLADLGVAEGAGSMMLLAPSKGIEPIAWATAEGRRGLLLWRDSTTGVYGFVAPPLWSTRFRAGASTRDGVGAPAAAWVRGASLWVRAHHGAQGDSAMVRDKSVKAPEDSARLGADVETLAALAAKSGGQLLRAGARWPVLPDGQVRERRTQSVSLTPPAAMALILALLFSGVWAWRKRRRLD